MIITNTIRRTKRNSSSRLSKVQERKVVRMYLKSVSENLVGGFRFDFPNNFGSMAVIQREKSLSGKIGLKIKMFEEVKELQYKGKIVSDAIKFVPSQDLTALIRKQNINYRSELIVHEH